MFDLYGVKSRVLRIMVACCGNAGGIIFSYH